MATAKIPPQDVLIVDPNTGLPTIDYYDFFKQIDGLDPLSAIDNTALLATIAATYSTITRTVNAQTGTTYTLVLTDAGNLVTMSNAGAITATVPPNSSVAFPVNTQIDLVALGAGQVTMAQGAGVTINSEDAKKKLLKQYSAATLVKTATDVWLLTGSLTT